MITNWGANDVMNLWISILLLGISSVRSNPRGRNVVKDVKRTAIISTISNLHEFLCFYFTQNAFNLGLKILQTPLFFLPFFNQDTKKYMIHLIKDFVTENDQFVIILFPLVQRTAISTNFLRVWRFFWF